MISLREQLETEGFAVVPEVLEAETVDNITEHIERALKNAENVSSHGLRHLIQTVPGLQEAATCAPVRTLVEKVLGHQAIVVRSLFFDKIPAANWKVAWHQDITIAVRRKIEVAGFMAWSVKDGVPHVQPPCEVLERMLTVRLHLDDCDSTNGPLQVIPGSHKVGRLNADQISKLRRQRHPVICVVPRGGALLMRPLLLHASSPALHPTHRRVVHLEFAVAPLSGGLEWFSAQNQ